MESALYIALRKFLVSLETRLLLLWQYLKPAAAFFDRTIRLWDIIYR